MRDVALVVVARAPEVGRAKTRLAAAVGVRRAHEIYRELLRITATAVAGWEGPVLVAAMGDRRTFDGTGLERWPMREQNDGSLGDRIANAMAWGFEAAPRSLVIGSDLPAIDTAGLRAVGRLLDSAVVAIGPADDGGFWAIGAADPAVAAAIASAEVRWSTHETMATIRAYLAARRFRSVLGPWRWDCDNAVDLERAIEAGHLARTASEDQRTSVSCDTGTTCGPTRAKTPATPQADGSI